MWESGAIIEYLIERYDTGNNLGFPQGTPEYYHAKQWLFFQTTGQGPYYGQAGWFRMFHAEKIPSAIERYAKEVNRVTGVLETHLAKQKVNAAGDGPWVCVPHDLHVRLSMLADQKKILSLLAISCRTQISLSFPGRLSSRRLC